MRHAIDEQRLQVSRPPTAGYALPPAAFTNYQLPVTTPFVIVSFERARQTVEEHARTLTPTDAESVDLLRALGRVLAEDIPADRDLPPFPRATRDGFAVRAADLTQLPARLRVTGEIRAGASVSESAVIVRAGEAIEIMTGAPVPEGADSVVMVEYTARDGNVVSVQRATVAGENVVPRAAEGKHGDVLLCAGARLGASQIAVVAATGHPEVLVRRRPRVAIISTGDEVVEIAATPGPNEIRNSNSYSLAAQVLRAGGQPLLLPIAPDLRERLFHLVQQGLAADLLVLTGGVSMGKHDLVEDVLQELGAEFFFTGAEIQPGRPVVFGRAPNPRPDGAAEHTYFVGLPGNPISTMVCFELFARVAVEALSGTAPQALRYVAAVLGKDVRVKTGLTRFLPAALTGKFDQLRVELVPWQGSGDLGAAARANCLLVVPPDRERLEAGGRVNVLMLE